MPSDAANAPLTAAALLAVVVTASSIALAVSRSVALPPCVAA